jgi:hypothetical protein
VVVSRRHSFLILQRIESAGRGCDRAGFGVVGHIGGRFLLAGGSVSAAFRTRNLIFVAAAIMAIALYLASRRALLSQSRLLDLGLVFYVTGYRAVRRRRGGIRG